MSQQSALLKMDELLYLKHASEWELPNMSGFRRILTKLGAVDGGSDEQELHVRLLLRGIASTNAGVEEWETPIRPVKRVEIFGDWYTRAAENRLKDRGLVLFDGFGRPLVHACDALIEYGGAGPAITEGILEELGVDSVIFSEIQAAHAGILSTDNPYYVVIQATQDDSGRQAWQWASVKKSLWD